MEVFNHAESCRELQVLLWATGMPVTPSGDCANVSSSLDASNASDLPTIQRSLDGHTDALSRCLDLAVFDMGVTHRHARPLVAEQTGDDGQRDAKKHGVAGERVTKVMNSDFVQVRFRSYAVPELVEVAPVRRTA